VNQEFYRLQRRQSKGCEKKGMVVHTWNPSTLEADIRRKAHSPGPVQAKKKKIYKVLSQEMAGCSGVYLSSSHVGKKQWEYHCPD
jgi:hypothetical protein